MLTAAAPAKLNLYLHIHGKRPDGYHLLESLVVFTDFGDHVAAETHDSLSLSVEGEFAEAPGNHENNLVLKAARALQQACGVAQGARLTLTKHIPVGAGLGGGSADAAAALKLLTKLWAVIPSHEQLQQIAISLGADVPMCLAAQPLIARGIGDHITLLKEPLPLLHVVLVYPRVHLSTPDVYKRYEHDYVPTSPVLNGTDAETFIASLDAGRNQLQRAAISLSPEVAEVLLVLEAYPQSGIVRMCGSGSSCFVLCDNAKSAESLAKDIAERYPNWWVRKTHIAPLR